MSDQSRLDRIYAQLMCHHPYGWALYKKVTCRDLFPGCCGYFDPDGDWHIISDLNNPAALASQGWKVPEITMCSRPPTLDTWGPKVSGRIKSQVVGGTIGTTVTPTPIDVGASMLFKVEDEHGAVLATESPVKRLALDDERGAVQWMVDNKHTMLRLYGDVLKKHGIWIVTKTYSSRRCAIAVMSTRSSTVNISLSADAQGLLTLTPQSAWTESTGDCSTEMHEDQEDGVVVFISGIYFSPKLFSKGLKQARDQHDQKKKIFRGDGCTDPHDRGDAIELNIEVYPSDEHTGL